MRTIIKCLISVHIVGCMACASEQTPKPSEYPINQAPIKDAAQTFRTMIYEREALDALYLHPNASQTDVLQDRPCRITASTYRGVESQPQDKRHFYTVEVQYDANDRVIATKRISDRSVTTHTLTYEGDKLIKHRRVTVKRGKLKDNESITTQTRTLKHDARGRLFTLTMSQNGVKQYRHIYDYDNNGEVKIATHSIKEKTIARSILSFDDAMHVKQWREARYSYQPNKITVANDLIEHDITLKDGAIKRIITTSALQGEEESTPAVTTVYHMRYADNQLARIVNHIHPKRDNTLYTMRDFDYMCQ